VLGIGGYSGFLMASEVMRSLPFGFPKILVSSAAAVAGLSNRLIQTSDILLFNSVVEIAGLTGLLKNVLDRGVLAMVGMVQGAVTEPSANRSKAIAMTMLSPCEGCARAVRAAIEKQAYPVVGFHATGIGDRAMEAMISEGLFRGVIDLAPVEWRAPVRVHEGRRTDPLGIRRKNRYSADHLHLWSEPHHPSQIKIHCRAQPAAET
jgi:uncharacterized protein (UPF0261 family)